MSKVTKYAIAAGAWGIASAFMLATAHDGGPKAGWDAFDLNKDGSITAAEFTTGTETLAKELQAKFLAKFDSIPAGATAGDGTITTAEATAVFDKQAADWLEHILETFDTNNDGAISSADTTPGRRRHPGRLQLDEYDANDDGTISNAELLAAADEKVESQLAKFLAKYDSIPTGATAGDGNITPAESLAAAQEVVAEHVERILERFDANNDGAVSSAEIEAVSSSRPKGRGGHPRRG